MTHHDKFVRRLYLKWTSTPLIPKKCWTCRYWGDQANNPSVGVIHDHIHRINIYQLTRQCHNLRVIAQEGELTHTRASHGCSEHACLPVLL